MVRAGATDTQKEIRCFGPESKPVYYDKHALVGFWIRESRKSNGQRARGTFTEYNREKAITVWATQKDPFDGTGWIVFLLEKEE